MSAITNFVAHLFASGNAFFGGVGLILVTRCLCWRFRNRPGVRPWRLFVVVGVTFIALSVIPLPMGLVTACVVLPMVGINSLDWEQSVGLKQLIFRCRFLVEFVLVAAVAVEVSDRTRLAAGPLERLPAEVHVIGDSLSAGIGEESDQVWPRLLSRRWNVPVINHAQPGATTASALRQAERVTSADALVLVEIGGNDLLSDRRPADIRRDLDQLLSVLCRQERTVVMFELPVPPIPNAFGLARLQRELSHRYGVRCLSRREISCVLFGNGSTTDGLHLSPIGHQRMLELVDRTLTPRVMKP